MQVCVVTFHLSLEAPAFLTLLSRSTLTGRMSELVARAGL